MLRKLSNPKRPQEVITTNHTDDEALNLARTYVAKNDPFIADIISRWDGGRRLSDAQWFWLHKKLKDALGRLSAVRPADNDAAFVGEGAFERVRALFDAATASGLRYPKIRFYINDGDDTIVMTSAGANSQQPGTINVQTAGGFGNRTWFGRIAHDDVFHKSRHCTEEVVNLVQLLCNDPLLAATIYGQRVGSCCFCHADLTDERSLLVGFGPVCAEKWGLPWGERPVKRKETTIVAI